MNPLLRLRLSDGVSSAVTFEAFGARSLERAATEAVRRWRVDRANQPGYFGALTFLAGLGRRIEADISEASGEAKRREWAERGHDAEARERLWVEYVHERNVMLDRARQSAGRYFVPGTLEIHQISTVQPDQWLNPWNDARARVLLVEDGVPQRLLRGARWVGWSDVWGGVVEMRLHDEQFPAFYRALEDDLRRDSPALRLVPTGPAPP